MTPIWQARFSPLLRLATGAEFATRKRVEDVLPVAPARSLAAELTIKQDLDADYEDDAYHPHAPIGGTDQAQLRIQSPGSTSYPSIER